MPRSALVLLAGLSLGLACRDNDGGYSCFPGNEDCPCVAGACLIGLQCVDDICVAVGETDPVDTDVATDGDSDADTDDTEDATTAAVAQAGA